MSRAVQKQGHPVVLLDLERTLDKDIFERVGLDPNNFLQLRPNYGEEAIDMALDAAEGGAKLIIIDSVAMLDPKAAMDKIEKDSEAQSMAALPGMLNRLKGKINNCLIRNDACLLLINQIRDKMTGYGGVQTPGGHAVKHLCSVRVQITHATKDSTKEGVITSHLLGVKNKTGTPGRSTSVIIEDGIVNTAASLVESSIEAGLLVKSGSWIKLSEPLMNELGLDKPNLAQGSVKTGELLKAQPELFRKLYYRTLQLHEIPEHQIPDFWKPTTPTEQKDG